MANYRMILSFGFVAWAAMANVATPTAQSPFIEEAVRRYPLGDCWGASQNLEAARALEPEKITSWQLHLLYHAQMSCGAYDRAELTAAEIVPLAANQPLSYVQLGLAQLWNRKPKPAIENFKRALGFDAHPPRTHFYLGLAYSALGDLKSRDKEFNEADLEYEKILSKNPKDFTAHFELASLYLFQNQNIEKASRHVALARENQPKNNGDDLVEDKKQLGLFHLPLLEGILLYRSGKFAEATEKLKSALAKSPSGNQADTAELYFYLAKSLQKLEQPAAAKFALQKHLELDGNGPYAKEATRELKSLK